MISRLTARYVRLLCRSNSAQGNLLLSLAPSTTASNSASITNPTQALIHAINNFRSANLAPLPTRAEEALSPAKGIRLGKGEKDEEYYLAIWEAGEDVETKVTTICFRLRPFRGVDLY